MAKIKICGLKREEDVLIVNEFKPDFVGFVFAGTKRKISDDVALKLKTALRDDILSVGVFVNDSPEHIVKLVDTGIIDMIQLHGDEDEEYIKSLRRLTDAPIIKAVRVKNSDSIANAKSLDADYLLLDTYHKDMYGGTGLTFDRKLIDRDLNNYFLAGGLSRDNLAQALSECNPYAVDISSSVETNGFKDRDKVRQVIEIVRNISAK